MPSRCLTLTCLALLAAATFASPLAAAQVGLDEPFRLSTSPSAREALPGQNATYGITIHNPGPLERSAQMRLVSLLPTGWTYSFTADPIVIASKANGTTSLLVHVPADAKAQTLDIVYEANDSFGRYARDTVTLTVKTPPAPETQTIGAPRIRLTPSTGDAGESGGIARGTLVLENVDPARPTFTASISFPGADGWRGLLAGSDTTRVLDHGVPVTIPLAVEIPDLAANTTKDLAIAVRVEATTFLAHWIVLGRAVAESETAGATSENTTQTTTAPTRTSAPRPPGPTGPNLEVLVSPLEIQVPANGETDALVRLSNTGNTDLLVALSGSPPASWSPLVFEATSIAIAAGEVIEVPMKVYAPDVPPGGRAQGAVSAQTTSGLVRGADFLLIVLPAAPRDQTNAALIEAPATPDGALPGVGTTALVVVGLAAVGGAAAFVVNRPLREKLLWGAAGLYTRLARPDVLGHEDREKLYRLVETQPGIHFHALQRDLAWNTGTLTYHLRVLEKHGFMVSRRDGLYRRFYLSGAAPRKEVFENQGPTGLRADVIEAIRNAPGISQSDLALGLGANKQTVNYHVKALERAGTIRVEKRGRDTFLYPGEPAATSGPGMARV